MDSEGSDVPGDKTENVSPDEIVNAVLSRGGLHDVESGPMWKKARLHAGGDMKRVAEIIMVMSAMGKLRGGRHPSGAEMGMMAEAREKLAGLCEVMVTPKDLVSRDAVKAVVDDLGFNKWKDQRFGFRMPRMSIAEKVAFMEKKAEESKEFVLRTGRNSQLLHTGFGSNAESCRFPLDKSSPMPNLSVGFRPASYAGPISTPDSVNPLNQSRVSEPLASSQLALSTNLSQSCSSSLAVSQAEGTQFSLGICSNVLPHIAQVGASSSNDHLLNKTPPPHYFQSSSTVVTAASQAAKVRDHAPAIAEGAHKITVSQSAPQAGRDNASKSFAIQTGNLYTVHQPSQGTSQGTNLVQAASLDSTHNDIARNVQKLLQPRVFDQNWTPVTDYINKPLPCQLCKVDINDAESLLVCDCCEKGVHLKCLQSFLPKAITKEDWHCPRCLIINKGKPIPPKYGRISRNVSASKSPPNASGVQSILEKKTASSDQKVNEQKLVVNGKHGLLNPVHVANAGNNHVKSPPDVKMPDAREVLGSDASIFRVKIDDGPCYGTISQTQERELSDPAGKTVERAVQNTKESQLLQSGMGGSTLASKLVTKEESEHLPVHPGNHSVVGIDTCHQSQFSCVLPKEDKRGVQSCLNTSPSKVNDMGKHFIEFKTPDFTGEHELRSCLHVKMEEQTGSHALSGGTSENGNGAINGSRFSSGGSQGMDWVDGILKIVDERAYYESCRINGTLYKLEDHILFTSNGHNLLPSKLQVLWEDNKTKLKWASVNLCYFPSDLPKIIDRPCSPENNEVYESNHQSTIMLGSIAGHCKVLPPNKYKEESERRINMEGASSGSAVFLCKWFYDESNGIFQSLSE